LSKSYIKNLQDKTSYIHIFSGLLKNPMLLSEYKLSNSDFPEKFHRVLFSAIHNLKENGITELSDITIDGYLKDMPTQQKIFEDNQGIEYINFCLENGEPTNFEYHYQRIKKFSLLREYASIGLRVEEIYNVGFQNAQEEIEQNIRFNNMSIEQITRVFEGKLATIKDDYIMDVDGFGGHSAQNVDSILEKAFGQPNYGAPFQSGFYNSITRGARRRKLYCRSGNSGSGKTRGGLADLAYQTMPIVYDISLGKWVFTGNMEKGLFISTELEEEEIVLPLLCYIANVEEENLHNHVITEEEQARLIVAKEILKKSHFYLEILFDFDADDLSHLIQKYVSRHDVGYVFFDYIQTTTKMFESMHKRGAKGLQEHQLLRILSVHLKNMCNKFNIWIGTSTQLNDKWKDDGNINLDASAIAGAKAIVDKLDLGAIQIPLTPKDLDFWNKIKQDVDTPMGLEPTHTINVFKNRGNRWILVRIWVHFEMGTLRYHDMFVTNYKNELVNIQSKMFVFESDFDLNAQMTADEVLDFITNPDNLNFEKEEYKQTEVNKKEEEEIKREMDSAYKDVGIEESSEDYDGYTEDELPESFDDAKGKGFGESKAPVENVRQDW